MAQKASGGRTPEQVARDIKDYVQGKAGRRYRWRGTRAPQGSNVFDNTDPSTTPVGMTPEQLTDYRIRRDMVDSDLLGEDYSQQRVNPYRVFGDQYTVRDMEAALDAFNHSRDYDRSFGSGGYSPPEYTNLGDDTGVSDRSPAPLSVVPTTTSNHERPRTVAAGWQATNPDGTGTLTVVFRDGTYYNYYDVSARQWDAFKSSASKGRYIRKSLDSHDRGRADMDGASTDARAIAVMSNVYATARAGQAYAYSMGKWRNDNRRTTNRSRTSASHRDTSRGLAKVNPANRKKR